MTTYYYGDRISPNMTLTPEGVLICHSVPIARIGSMQYRASDVTLDDGQTIDIDPLRIIDIHRMPDEVFALAAIASFEGKPITSPHPPEDVIPANYATYAKGHIQHVHRGAGDLQDFLLADLWLTDPLLIADVQNKILRDVSCGYNCKVTAGPDGKYYQATIRGNHLAVVPEGRAGSAVAIRDSLQATAADNDDPTLPLKEKRMSDRTNPSPVQRILRLFGLAVRDAKTADEVEAITEDAAATIGQVMSGADTTDAADATDTADATDSTDAADATDASDTADTADATDAADTADNADATDATDSTDAADATDQADTADKAEPDAEASTLAITKALEPLMTALAAIAKRLDALEGATATSDATDASDAVDTPKDEVDELLEALGESTEEIDPVANEESVTVPAEQVDTADCQGAMDTQTRDAAVALLKKVRPIIAGIQDAAERKRVVDAFTDAFLPGGREAMTQIMDAQHASSQHAHNAAPVLPTEQQQAEYDKLNPHKAK
jgi:hypothetical protein